VPFLISLALLVVSLYIRLQMQESPAFKKMKEEGTHSKAPLAEAFGQWKNARVALLALLGLTAGQAVVWYTGQFYALFFLQSILKVDILTANVLIAWSLVLGTVGFIVFGTLSDRIGRKPIILGGCVIAALTYFPLFGWMTQTANPALHKAQASTQVVVKVDPAECSFQFNPVGTAKFTSGCDIAKAALARSSVMYRTEPQAAGFAATVSVAGKELKVADAGFARDLGAALTAAGYPGASNPTIVRAAHFFDVFNAQAMTLVLILTILVVYVTMVYGPIAAALVELFPTRIRYTAMSLRPATSITGSGTRS
jgi:Na+/melibiose symporter-like transporter